MQRKRQALHRLFGRSGLQARRGRLLAPAFGASDAIGRPAPTLPVVKVLSSAGNTPETQNKTREAGIPKS
jgi:hypothetical protein